MNQSIALPSRRLSLVAAMGENRVIGSGGGLPWKLPDEMQQFRALTLGHAVIMGRQNFEAEGKPLPHRRNLVLTRQSDWSAEGVEVFNDLNAAVDAVADDVEPFIVGGQGIYELALPRVDRMYLTTVHGEFAGDTFFPEFDEAGWRVIDQRHHAADGRHEYAFTIRTYDRAT